MLIWAGNTCLTLPSRYSGELTLESKVTWPRRSGQDYRAAVGLPTYTTHTHINVMWFGPLYTQRDCIYLMSFNGATKCLEKKTLVSLTEIDTWPSNGGTIILMSTEEMNYTYSSTMLSSVRTYHLLKTVLKDRKNYKYIFMFFNVLKLNYINVYITNNI